MKSEEIEMVGGEEIDCTSEKKETPSLFLPQKSLGTQRITINKSVKGNWALHSSWMEYYLNTDRSDQG